MSWRRLLAVGLVAAGACAAAAIVAAAIVGGSDLSVPAPARPVVAVAQISPQEHYPGDEVTATLDLSVNRALVDPADIEVQAGFRPYTRVAPVEIERTEAGEAVLVRYVYRLQCLDRACIMSAGTGPSSFAPAVVRYPDAVVGQATIAADWPPVTMSTRITAEDLSEPSFRTAAEPVAPSYGIAPGLLGWLLAGGAAALVLVVSALTARRLWRAAPAPSAIPEAGTADESLQAALAEVGRTRTGESDEDERRIALDTLARRLERDGSPELARDARRLAWSRASPEGKPLDDLCAAVAEALGEAA